MIIMLLVGFVVGALVMYVVMLGELEEAWENASLWANRTHHYFLMVKELKERDVQCE